jgi:hypothetical protein
MRHVFILLALTQLTLGCGTTKLTLKDGRKVRGMVTGSDATQIQLYSHDDGSALSVERSEVEDVEYAGDSVQSWGIGLTLGGGIISGVGATILSNSNSGWGAALMGGFLTIVGAPLVLTGVPLWIAGAARKNDQRTLYEFDAKTGMFNTPTQVGTYNLTLAF